MASTPVDDIANAIKDAAYVSVGLGVIAFQRIQVRRNELTKTLESRAEDAKSTIEILGAALGDRARMIEERVASSLNR